MGRKKGSKNVTKQPDYLMLSDKDKLSLIADLLLEIVIDELADKKWSIKCKTA